MTVQGDNDELMEVIVSSGGEKATITLVEAFSANFHGKLYETLNVNFKYSIFYL
jgi:hypothetical protein